MFHDVMMAITQMFIRGFWNSFRRMVSVALIRLCILQVIQVLSTCILGQYL